MTTSLEDLHERFPRVAVVHDWMTLPGGSEQVVVELLQMFPRASLFTAIYDPTCLPPQITERQVHTSFLDRIPKAAEHYQSLLPLMTKALRSFDLSRFDLVISSSHASAKNVRTPSGTLHVCYCHTPMRYAWDRRFLAEERVGRLVRLGLPALMWHLRRQDVRWASSPDLFIANSKHVAARIDRYYGRSSEVVHPPVDVEPLLGLSRDPQDYYLVFGRVVPYKRVDLAAAACDALGRKLKVAGDGRALAPIRSKLAASSTVDLMGRVSAAQREMLFSQARAVLFPGEEDFGIVPVEAQAAGAPVIAYGVGGAAESVIDSHTGVLFGEQTAEALAAAIERFESLKLDPKAARENAMRFGPRRFQREMTAAIARAAGM